MGKIFFISGKSSTGKDTIYNRLLEDAKLGLKKVTMYTTRPMRSGETDGVEYYFVSDAQSMLHEEDGSIVEMRVYNTVYGPWKYYTRIDGQIDLSGQDNYLAVGTIEAYRKYCDYYGNEHVVPIYIEIDDGVRLQRALDRERHEQEPHYREMCRRYIADDDDFSEENIKLCGIQKRFVNDVLEECIEEIKNYIFNILALPKSVTFRTGCEK